MNIIEKFKFKVLKYGFYNAIKTIITNRIMIFGDKAIYNLEKQILRNRNLENIIIIESHNDFDSNGGAFYNYLIKSGYNKKYKIVWFLWNFDNKPRDLPYNVECFSFYKLSIKKNYYMCIAKYFAVDDSSTVKKAKEQQMLVHLRHGAGGLKNVKGFTKISASVDYILGMSESYAKIESEQLSLEYPDKRLVFLGFPSHDLLFQDNKNEIKKVTNGIFNKIILWMPTFRRGVNNRNDSNIELPLGVPLINDLSDYKKLNYLLKINKMFLIIKIHPMQDLNTLKLLNLSNINILTGDIVKKLGIDNFRLMSCCDAMISDYSGAAYDFLQLNRPIAYVLSDMDEYKLGFVVEDIHSLIAGHEIYKYEDMVQFLNDVSCENDMYRKKREKIRNYIYKYHDGDNSKRLVSLMRLEK